MPLSQIQLSSSTGRRNMIINGDMRIAQRGTSGTPNDTYVSLDRFRGRTYGGSGRFTMEQVSGGNGGVNIPNGEFPYAMKLTVTTPSSSIDAYDYSIAQTIEADTFTKLGWGRNEASEVLKSCTVSFLMKTSVAGVYSVSLRSNGAGRSIVKETPSITADTWTKVVLTFPGTDNTSWRSLGTGSGCLFEINLGRSNAKNTSTLDVHQAGNKVASDNQVRWIGTNSATFFLTGLQIEEGTSATEFEHRSFQEEMQMCKRYYQHIGYQYGDSIGATNTFNGAIPGFKMGGTSVYYGGEMFPVEMRAIPTLTIYAVVSGTETAGKLIDFNSGADLGSASVARLRANGYNYLSSGSNSAGAVYRSVLDAEL